MNDFIVKLGESKAEKLQKEFTQIHNDTAYQIIQDIGPEAFAMYFTLHSLAFGKKTVLVDPNNNDLHSLVGKSERTVQRWKAKLQEANIIRLVSCYNLSGSQTANVIIFNASYPEIPEGWETFALNGFIQISEDENQPPMLREEYEQMLSKGVAIYKKKRHRNAQKRQSNTSTDVSSLGSTDVSSLAPTDVSPLAPTDVSPPKIPTNTHRSKDLKGRSYREDFKDINKTYEDKKTGTYGINKQKQDPRYEAFYRLFPNS